MSMPGDHSNEPRELMRQLIGGQLSRREFIQRAAALGFSTTAIAGFLAACGQGAPSATNVPVTPMSSVIGTAARDSTKPAQPALSTGLEEGDALGAFRNQIGPNWVDPRKHNLYYTYSKDGGRSFSAPLRLNQAPIVGASYVRTGGSSRPGEYMGMASTDAYAYPDTPETERTAVVMTRIER